MLESRIVALQLWDTGILKMRRFSNKKILIINLNFHSKAGQERYRSITKQYFRKADGVICMYDVTSEYSFKNLRNWLTSIKECVSEDCVLTIIGNKIDLCENDDDRPVKYKDGAQLADVCIDGEQTKSNTKVNPKI